MPSITLTGFTGIVPRSGPEQLGPYQAQVATDVKLQSGEIRSWMKPLSVTQTKTVTTPKSIYNLKGPSGASGWLEWTQADVSVVAGPLADTTDFRVYFTSAGFAGPRKTNWSLATTGARPFPVNYYEMGTPGPVGAPSLSPAGGSAPTEVRSYVYTYLTTFGTVVEESAPSPATTVTCNSSGATVSVSAFSTPPVGNYNFTALRIYRTVVGATTVTYQLVDQLAFTSGTLPSSGTSLNGVSYTASTYPDTRTVAQLGTSLVSLLYTPPPATLQGIVTMPNGMLAGFTGNQIWFCEPYQPHAWPSVYTLTTDSPIIGLGVFGTTLFVGTNQFPYLITGSTPSSMTQERLSIPQPCVSLKSIVYDQWGVVYASPNGLVAIGPGTQDVITSQLYTRDEWQAINPSSLVAVMYNNIYMGFYNISGVYNGIAMARNDTPQLTSFDFPAVAVYEDRTTGNVYTVNPNDAFIYQLDADTVNNTIYQWKSKKFVMPEPTSFAAFKMKFDLSYQQSVSAFAAAYAAAVAANLVIWTAQAGKTLHGDFNETLFNVELLNGSDMVPLPTASDVRSVGVTIYADEVAIFSTQVTSQEPIRLPATTKAYVWEIQIIGNVPVRTFAMATTMGELAAA